MNGKDLRESSGPWSGFYEEDSHRGDMRIHMDFRGNQILGAGDDIIGAFLIAGDYEPSTEKVSFAKNYHSHQVRYEGKWDGYVVFGRWEIMDGFGHSGNFEIWPDDEELNLNFNEVEVFATAGR